MRDSQRLLISPILAFLFIAAGFWWCPDVAGQGAVPFEIKGYIIPARVIRVSPRVAGEIVELRIEEGQSVKAGDVLARLDPTEQTAALRVARAQLQVAQCRLEKARASGLQTDVTLAQAELEVARARLVLAEQRLDATVIRAPANGTVLVKHAESGTRLDPAGHRLSAVLCELADLQHLEVEIWLPEKDLEKIAKGQQAVIRPEAFPRASYRGSVCRILPVADRAKGAVGVRLRLEVPAGDHRLRPELGAVVQILGIQ